MSKEYAQANAKKKKKEETVKKAQSPSSSTSTKSTVNRLSNKYGGGSSTGTQQKTVKRPPVTRQNTKLPARSTTTNTTAAQADKNNEVKQRLNNKYGGREWQERVSIGNQKISSETAKDIKDRRDRAQKQRAISEENKGFMQRQKSGIQTEADKQRTEEMNKRWIEIAKNTGAAAKKGVQDAGSGFGKSLADLDEMVKSNENWSNAKAMKMGLAEDDIVGRAKIEGERQQSIKEAKAFREDLGKKQDERQAEWDERTKNAKGLEKAWYGAVESGAGMAVDAAVGTVTGTGQFGSLASMGLRTYGQTRGQAEKEGAAESEDRLYSFLQAGKEVGTELLFPGAGLARKAYGRAGLSVADKTAKILTRNLTGKTADIVGAGVRLFGGTVEENAEELAGWGLDPLIKEFAYGRNVRQRMAEALRAGIPEITNQAEAEKVASYFSTSQFTDELTKEYVESGMSKEDASELAAEMRDYYVAYYSGDEKTFKKLENDIAGKLSGQTGISRRSWSMSELADTFASTTLLTMVTGAPGAVKTSVKGNQIFESPEVKAAFGDDAVKLVADAVRNSSDADMAIKAESMLERLESGKDLTGTQKYDLWEGYIDKVNETAKKAEASDRVVRRAISDNNYVPIMARDRRTGQRFYAKATQAEFEGKYDSALGVVDTIGRYLKAGNSITDTEGRRAEAVAEAVADLHVGGLTVGDAHEFAYGNNLARETLKAEEGIDLDQYVVYKADGTVDYPATNEATENALFEISAANAIESAKKETDVYIDTTKGAIDTDLMSRLGAEGQAIWKDINQDLDPRDMNKYLTTANAASTLYAAGRNTTMTVSEAVDQFAGTLKSVDKNVLRRAFAAGARDRIKANTPGYGHSVEAGSNIAMKDTTPILTGNLIIEDGVELPESTQSAYLALAQATNTNIHLVASMDILDKDGKPVLRKDGQTMQMNGESHGNEIYLNVNANAEQNLGYVFMHEMTHQIKQYAPNQYMALENLVRDKWFRQDHQGMQKAIKDKQALYKRYAHQELSEEDALEEIIADAMAEAIDDPNFAAEVCEQDESLGQAVLNSIKAALRSMRRMFAGKEFQSDRFHNGLLSYLEILDQAERMWMDALAVARQNKADGLIADWDARSRASIGYHAGDLGKSTVDDYAHQGYGRGTGHFGFGTYFVGDEEQINYGDYGQRKHETVDFDKYNLFKPRDAEHGWKLHEALKLVDGFITEYSRFNQHDRYSDERLENYLNNTSRIKRSVENLVDDFEWDDYKWTESNLKNKEAVDKYIADNLDEDTISEIERKARQRYEDEQSKAIDEDSIRRELEEDYGTYKGMKDFFGQDFIEEDTVEEYIQNELAGRIESRNRRKAIPYEYYYYDEAKEAIDQAAEDYEWKDKRLGHLTWELESAFNFKHSESEIERALRETEEIVNGYQEPGQYRLYAEPGLDSAATVFMKQLGYEGVDVRHIKELDNTGYGSVIYDLKGEDLARKQEIGTARFSIPEYTQEEMDEHRQYLIDTATEFYDEPYTEDPNESGFILPDGKLPRMGMYGSRADDHNLIIGAYDDIGYDTSMHPKADAMARFLNEGNIRYMPENGTIEFGTEIEPTYEQYARIRSMDYVNMIEFTNPEGETVDFKEYDGNRSGVINDIKRFYREGQIGGSQLSQFRYSLSSTAEAVGTTITKKNGKIIFTDDKGEVIEHFTPELIKETPIGRVLGLSASKAFNVMSDEAVNERLKFLSQLLNLISDTQDPDLIWAVSGTIGYNPNNPINEATPQDKIKEKKSKFASITGNSDPQYQTTIDFTTICVKTQAVIDAMSATMKQLHRGLTEHEIIDIVYNETKIAGEQVPCPVCYVFSRWVGLGNLFTNIKKFQEKYPADMDMSEIRKTYNNLTKQVDKIANDLGIKGGDARTVLDKQIRQRIEELEELQWLYKAQNKGQDLTDEQKAELYDLKAKNDVLDHWSWLGKTRLADDYKEIPDDILFDINAGREFATEYPAVWRYRTTRGPSLGKAAAPYSPSRLGDTIRGIASPSSLKKIGEGTRPFLSKKGIAKGARNTFKKAILNAKRQNRMNGQRLQSTSDFRFEYGLDYLLSMLELEAIGAKAQMYTKVPEAVKFLASTKAEVNCSIMAKGTGLDENGNLVFSDVTGMAWEDALALSKAYDNVQPILVAIGPEHLRAAMASKDITMIIPYHASGSSEARYVSMMQTVEEAVMNRTDFAEYESEHDIENATKEQKHCRKLRVDILTGKFEKSELSEKDKAALENNEILRQLYIRVYGKDETGKSTKPDPKYVENFDENGNDADCFGVYLTKAQANVMMPYEYWDKHSTIDSADAQGKAYVDYCASLGITPVFSGWDSKGKYDEKMDFSKDPGYWKTLIDRCMYNNDGSYHKQSAVNLSDVDLNMLDSTQMRAEVHKPLQVNDPEKTADIANKSMARIAAETGEEYTPISSSTKFSIQADFDNDYMDAVTAGNMEEAKRLVGEAARRAGYKFKVYHGTISEPFTQFMRPADNPYRNTTGSGFIYASTSEDYAENYAYRGEPFTEDYDEGYVLEGYLNIDNMLDVGGVDDFAFRPTDGTSDLFMDIDFNDEAKINAWATDDFYNVAKAVGMTPFELVQELGETIFNESESTWEFVNRPEYAKLVSDLGHDGIKVIEDGSDAYGVMEPNQFKSADAVTYADDGSVIPLSERFDPTNNDIRYSMPTMDSDDNILSDGQMEYFKNSQARDEQGRLVPVYHGTFRGPRITIFEGLKDGIWFTSDRDIAEEYSMGYEMGIPGALSGDERNPYDTDDEYFAKKGIRIEQNSNGDWVAAINRNGRDHYWGAAETKEELINSLYESNENEDLFDSQFSLRDVYPTYLNLENPKIIECNGTMHDDVNGTGMTTRELAAEAMTEGYDGIIFHDVVDPFEAIDVYVAFSSEQIKDVRNTDPTNNPDIRYSLTDPDEARSQQAYDDAWDNSIEELSYYETILGDSEAETTNYLKRVKKLSEDEINAFYDGLNAYEDHMVFDDPVLEEGRVRMAKSRNDYMARLDADWNQAWLTNGEILNVSSVETDIRKLVMATMKNSDTDRKYKSDVVKKTLIDVRTAYEYAQKGRTDVADALLWHSARRMIENIEFINDETFNEYKSLRDYLRTTRVQLGEEYWSDVDFGAFRKNYFNRIKLVKGETNVDDVYMEMCELWPEWFKEDDELTPPDQLERMAHVLDAIQPYKEAYTSEEAAALTSDIADALYTILKNGKPLTSLGDQLDAKGRRQLQGLYNSFDEQMANAEAGYEARIEGLNNNFDEQTKAMKQRHEEALRKVEEEKAVMEDALNAEIDELKRKAEEDFHYLKFVQANERAERMRIIAERDARMSAKRKERTAHSKYFKQIKKLHKNLTERLMTNTVDKHIPEQYKRELAKLLAAFDLQTTRSKSIEANRGYKAMSTLKLGAIKATLQAIEEKSEEFHVNDAITNLFDELLGPDGVEGKTIDALDSVQLRKIRDLLQGIVHEFNTYESVRKGAKRQQTADVATAQIDTALAHAETYGPGKDYFNFVGALDKIVNMDEMTAAYLFKRIDPNREGLGGMYRELRRSFDKYVRNQNQLNEWMEEIVGPYHNKGIINKYGSGELADWRSSNYARTFDFKNGSVTLTPAQMMSIYCLSKRQQAYSHMTGAGIIVAPVSFQAKMMSDLKKKADMSLPIILTDDNIKTIVSQLTKEQIKVADQLQKLMATKMADWGNEASMSVIGIKLFNEPDYFPIKSDKAALTKDLNEQEFVEAIRNFGFTKAVKPGARNAIMVDDIFDVVAEHCNNMNLYNSYSESINDFMKVYNYRQVRDDGREYTVQQAIAHAYSRKATTFIMRFMRDLNGNVSGKDNTGIESMLNGALANAKKASVFANGRVLLQQPTAIVRAFAVIDPKYLKGIRVKKGAMQEMFEHCPIAMWKMWGNYDINMSKSIEDIMMNNGSITEDVMTELYGKADNITWTAIWQMVKAEIKEKNPNVKEGSDEFWDLCNERMTDIVDLTQVVDSPFHRSHAMRSKGFMTKLMTSFMSEPTLTFNMVRDGIQEAHEAYRVKDYGRAGKALGRTLAVFAIQAAAVSAASAIWDAIRGKDPGDGDDDDDEKWYERFGRLWQANFFENMKDNINLLNNIYYVKDVASIFGGWGSKNLAMQGWETLYNGIRSFKKKVYEGSKTPWITIMKNIFGGIGYLTGMPLKTIINDGMSILKLFGVKGAVIDTLTSEEKNDPIFGSDDIEEGGIAMKFIGLFRSDTAEASTGESEGESSSEKKDSGKGKSKKKVSDAELGSYDYNQDLVDAAEEHFQKLSAKAAEQTSGMSGNALNTKLWDILGDGYSKAVEAGNFGTIYMMREAFIENGGDANWFDAKITEKCKTAYKKTLNSGEIVPGSQPRQDALRIYMQDHGVTDVEISDICYHSLTARDLKAAMRMGNEQYIQDELSVLLRAGLLQEDYEKLWKYRNYGAKSYDGKYSDPKYKMSTGTYNWPISGEITSNFGHRSSPGGIGSTNHMGVDIAGSMGDPIGAADAGVVTYVGWYGGAGNTVFVQHDDGTVTQYSHMSCFNVQKGDQVSQGQQIGQVGSTGNSTGPHLHFGVMKDGQYVDPLNYLNK